MKHWAWTWHVHLNTNTILSTQIHVHCRVLDDHISSFLRAIRPDREAILASSSTSEAHKGQKKNVDFLQHYTCPCHKIYKTVRYTGMCIPFPNVVENAILKSISSSGVFIKKSAIFPTTAYLQNCFLHMRHT